MTKSKNENWIVILLLIIISTGILISILNLLHNRSLWLDEAMLALNIVNKSYSQLLLPLDMGQVAPIGFLYMEKLMVSLFGNQDLVLRIFPLLAFIFSIPFFFIFSKKLFNSTLHGLLVCSFFNLNQLLLSYSSMVKQYSTDIFIMLLIVVTALNYESKQSSRNLIIYAAIGIGSIWFSNISVIILFTVGLFSLYHKWANAKNILSLLFVIFLWLVSFFIYFSFFIYKHPTQSTLVGFWGNSFLPQNIFSLDFYTFLFQKVGGLLKISMPFGRYWIFSFILFFSGIFHLIKERKFNYLYLLLSPIILHLIISSFKLYPFSSRLILYMIPLVIVICTFGLLFLYHYFNEHIFKIPISVILLPLILNFIILSKYIPTEIEEIKKSMAYLNDNFETNDKLYIYHGAIPAFKFYKNYFPKISQLQSINFGNSHYNDWSKYNEEILKLTENNWLIFSHVYPFVPADENEEGYMIKTLEANGYQILNQQKFKGSSVYKIAPQSNINHSK